MPSSATCPSFTKPACSQSDSTCEKSAPRALRCRLRKSLIVRKSGFCSAVTAMKSTRCSHAKAIRRDEYTPWQYEYKSSAAIIAGWYGGYPRSSAYSSRIAERSKVSRTRSRMKCAKCPAVTRSRTDGGSNIA